MRSSTIVAASFAALSILSSTSASAESRPKSKTGADKKSAPTLVASVAPAAPAAPVEALPPLPAPVVAPVTPPKDEAASSAGSAPSAGPGFVFSFMSGPGVLGGKIADGLDVGAILGTIDLRVGAYVTPHVGILAGIQGGYGALWSGCAGSCTNALSFQVPVVVQYAFNDRARGPYIDGGLALFTTYAASTNTKANPNANAETLSMSAPFDFKVGAGWRIATGVPAAKVAKSSLDLHLGVDFGQFKSVAYKSVAGSVDGDIADGRQAMHYVFGFTVGANFAP